MQTDEERAQEALYGPLTRSGQVTLTPLYPGRDGLPAGTPREREWMDWDSIVWDWPSAVFTIEEFEDGFVYQIKKSFEVTVKSGETVTINGPAYTVH